jgi:glycyl-tRNA synthetase beta chain
MAELFLELFSEEIPARMQPNAATELNRLMAEALTGLKPRNIETWYGPRRLAARLSVEMEVAASTVMERGPRISAPDQALAGFLRKHGATREQMRQEGGYWVLERSLPAVPASEIVATALPPMLRRFPWQKSMRWGGGGSSFTWVRPLRRIVCLLDQAVVAFDLRDGTDDGHGLVASNHTEGHRFHAPGAFAVSSCADWRAKLAERRVLVDASERRRRIEEGLATQAAESGLELVDDPGLLDEVAGLVEWPVPMLGRIDPTFMDLPPEVMQVSMRVNQRYFALRRAEGPSAPWFGFVANIEADDGGDATRAGNERVLRARFADARHFWDLDRRTPLVSRVPLLDQITFHAKLGSQGERVGRLRRLVRTLALLVGGEPALADRAAECAKADLITGMVAEFPELQGVMGRYYALHDGEEPAVADAIRDHYAPRGPRDAVPAAPVSIALALADKLDQLAGFFGIGEKPTGSGDPYALRRAALGIIRLIVEQQQRVSLRHLIAEAFAGYQRTWIDADVGELFSFIVERLRIQLRTEGARHDVMAAVFEAHPDDDLTRLIRRTDAVTGFLASPDGADLLTAYRRAANILRIEERKDAMAVDVLFRHDLLTELPERHLASTLEAITPTIVACLEQEDFEAAMARMALLRAPLDAFFQHVTVNAPDPDLRMNRLRLLAAVRHTMSHVADFSKIDG